MEGDGKSHSPASEARIIDPGTEFLAQRVQLLTKRVLDLEAERTRLLGAIRAHHGQRADDRCVEDDDRLYAAAGLSPVDRRVGDKAAMLQNCERFIQNRCEAGGPWKSYADLEAENRRLRNEVAAADLAWQTAAAERDQALSQIAALPWRHSE